MCPPQHLTGFSSPSRTVASQHLVLFAHSIGFRCFRVQVSTLVAFLPRLRDTVPTHRASFCRTLPHSGFRIPVVSFVTTSSVRNLLPKARVLRVLPWTPPTHFSSSLRPKWVSACSYLFRCLPGSVWTKKKKLKRSRRACTPADLVHSQEPASGFSHVPSPRAK